MKLLFVTPRYPWPPDRGDRLTAFSLLRVLAHEHEVTLLSHVDGDEPPAARAAVLALGVRIETVPLSPIESWTRAWLGLFAPEPSQVAYYRSALMRDLVERHVRNGNYAVVWVQLFRMAQSLDGIEHPAKVLFLADSIALNLARARSFEPWWKRPVIGWESRRVAAYEVEAARSFREAWVVSPVDRDDLRARGVPHARLVPHGVDEALFSIVPERAGRDRVMFLGNLSVPHNVDAAVFAAREVLPELRRLRGDAELWLVGAGPRRPVRALASLPGVTVTGTLPDLKPLWAAAHVLLAPLRFSSGIQNKVLEAMAAGVPVVTTPAAAAGLGVPAADVLRIGDDAPTLASETARLLADPADAAALAARARAYARQHFSWNALGRELERVANEARAEALPLPGPGLGPAGVASSLPRADRPASAPSGGRLTPAAAGGVHSDSMLIKNALTIDFEDWYHGIEIPHTRWQGFEERIEASGKHLLAILRAANVRATFFVLGWVADRHPELIRAIAADGHEIGTHGWSHTLIYRQSPREFRDELQRSVDRLRELSGKPVLGHRAPFFSITARSIWALDILKECGLRYDSSVFPVHNYRYGLPGAPRWPHMLAGPGQGLREFPMSTLELLGRTLPIAGGAYFRIYPYAFTRWACRRINRQGRPFTFYLHPWELDPGHPRIALPRRISFTHYYNLAATEGRLKRLLADFRFAPMGEVLDVV